MRKEFCCKYCKQVLNLDSKQIGGHVRNCKDNPKREEAYKGFNIKGPEITLQKSLLKQKDYNENPKFCKECEKKIEYEDRFKKFCNSSCAASFNNRIRSEETKQRVRVTLLTRVAKERGLTLEEYLQTKKKKERVKKEIRQKSSVRHIGKIKWICPVCERELDLSFNEARKRKYCCGTCRNKVNNKLIFGSRSKAERILEEKLKESFPGLVIEFNTRKILSNNKELDVFIPKLNLAIEWNGVYHYVQTRTNLLEETQQKDKIKAEECKLKNIELVVIKDLTSSEKFIKEEVSKLITLIQSKLTASIQRV